MSVPEKADMSSTCGMHYGEYWRAVHIDHTMAQKDFDEWLANNCSRCNQMSDICMKE